MPPLPAYENSVFINCPFDEEYNEVFRAVVFTVRSLGFLPKCALSVGDGVNRLSKIIKLISECKYSIHDISRIELDKANGLPRFNMPFELGIDTGCRYLGGGHFEAKCHLIMDSEKYRYQKFLSDMAGVDIEPHDNDPGKAIKVVRDWFQTSCDQMSFLGAAYIKDKYALFREDLPDFCKHFKLDHKELIYVDYTNVIHEWLEIRKVEDSKKHAEDIK